MTVFSKVALTVRALAKGGRVILVGRGGVFLTRGMPGGIHIRLDAPLERRIQHMMQLLDLSHDRAAHHVRDLSKRRASFYKRFWPNESLHPDLFTLTINTASVSADTTVQIIANLVKDATKKHQPASMLAAAI